MFISNGIVYASERPENVQIIARIGDADAVLLSYTSQINRYI